MLVAAIKKDLLSRIGTKVDFGDKKGILLDRVVHHVWSNEDGTEHYFDVIDYIRFEEWFEQKKPHKTIRLTYWVWRNGKLTGGRIALTEPTKVLVDLFEKAARKDWFRDFLKQVLID